MTDYAETPSTVIDTDPGPSAAGGGTPSLTEPADTKADAPLSLREDLEAAFKEGEKPEEPAKDDAKAGKMDDGKEEKPEAKKAEKQPKDEVTTDAKADDKAEKPDAAPAKDEPAPKKEAEPEDEADRADAKFHEPPKNFLPDSREKWRNVPRAVRRDIDTMVQEYEGERERFREVSDRYDRIKPFDELTRQNGRDLVESLTKMHQIEQMMSSNPVAALNSILMEVGPRKADGQPVSLMEVAQFVTQQGPQGYQQLMEQARQQPQQQQGNPEVEQLRAQLAEIQQQQVAATIIEPFRAKHPRYDELQDDIAFFLESGKISSTLSPAERLEAAYDMAARINPASHGDKAAASDVTDPVPDRRADPDFSGSKSIKSSPGSVTEEVEDQAKGGESVRDSLLKEMRRLNRA